MNMTMNNRRRRQQRFPVALLLFAQIVSLGQSLLLNVHLPLRTSSFKDLCLSNQALASNLALRQAAPTSEQINLFSNHTAHITLYLVDFDVQDENGTIIDPLLQTVLNSLQHAVDLAKKQVGDKCRVDWPNLASIQGDYAMFFIDPTPPCLQLLSDHVVNATMRYIRRPPPIPDWIHHLPEPQRRQALERVLRYGSPNVFQGFKPHVTVGYDTVTPASQRLSILNDMFTPQPCYTNLKTIAVGLTGLAGTVLKGGELWRTSLTSDTEQHDAAIQ